MQRGQKETTGQAPQREQGLDKSKQGAEKSKSQRNREQTTGQGQSQSPRQMQREQTQGQAPQRQQGQQGQTGAAPQGQGQAQQGQTGGGNNVTLNSEQRTKIRQSVLSGGHAPRVNNVNFSLSVGTVVPRSVRVVAVPRVIWEIHPAWREYMYFVTGDQIIIVDRGHHIVAVLAV